jgi:hypothetical protein
MTIRQTAAWLLVATVTAFCITAAPALTKSHSNTLAPSQSWSQPADFVSFGGTFETAVY